MESSAAPEDVRVYVESLVRGLQRWDPRTAASGNERHAKQAFIDALTEISALPADSLAMEVRRLLVDVATGSDADGNTTKLHLDHLVAALEQRDVLLKCKAANAIGSICTSRVAGQQFLDTFGSAFLPSLSRMATSKNTWAQADAFFVFGWIVVIGEDALVQDRLSGYAKVAVKLLHKNLTGKQSVEEQDANMRIYCLVFLLNWSQRDASILAPDLERILSMLQLLIAQLLQDAAQIVAIKDQDLQTAKLREHIEFGRLTVTLLAAMVDQIEDTTHVILSLRMLPDLLKLEKALASDTLRRILDGSQDDDDGATVTAMVVTKDVLTDMSERLRFVKESVLVAHR